MASESPEDAARRLLAEMRAGGEGTCRLQWGLSPGIPGGILPDASGTTAQTASSDAVVVYAKRQRHHARVRAAARRSEARTLDLVLRPPVSGWVAAARQTPGLSDLYDCPTRGQPNRTSERGLGTLRNATCKRTPSPAARASGQPSPG